MKTKYKVLSISAFFALTLSCASLHHVQIGEMDQSAGKLTPFDLKTNEFGIDVGEAAHVAKAISHSKGFDKGVDTVENAWQMITFGPKTGAVIFSDTYASHMVEKIWELCPSRRVTGLFTIRESINYPIIKGEIVKIRGYCINL